MNTYLYKLKTSVVLCLLIGLGPSIYSQNKDKSETFSQEDKLTSYFDIISRIPQEKLYLQLDKPTVQEKAFGSKVTLSMPLLISTILAATLLR